MRLGTPTQQLCYGIAATLVVGGAPLVFPDLPRVIGLSMFAAAGLILLVVVLNAVVHARRHSQRGGAPAPVPFEAPRDAELRITLDREEIHPFQWKANIVELKLSVQNRTDRTKYLPGPLEWTIDGPTDWGQAHDVDVHREQHALQRRRQDLVGTIPPREAVTGWVSVVLPHQPTGGVGSYTLTLEDELGTQYRLRKERRGSRL